jgi:aspartate aminotransferase
MNGPLRKQVSLNLNVRGMHQSATLAIKDRCRELRRAGRRVYDLGLGQSPFPVPGRVVEALRLAASEKDYLPVRGLPALREAVADFHRRLDGIERDPDDVIVGPGSKELMFLLQIAYYGEIILPTPCWVSYLPQARIIGRRISLVHTSYESEWKVTAAQLRHSFEMVGDHSRPRLLVLNYPSNPTGATYSDDELCAIADVAREFEIVVLSDEIYAQLHFTGGHRSIAHHYPEGTIVSSGLSKWCGAGGWRLGTFTFPPDLRWLRDAMTAVASETFTSVSAPVQYAAVHAFRCGAEIEHYLWQVRRILRALASRCHSILHDAGMRIVAPEGAFYLFPDFAPFSDRLAGRSVVDGVSLGARLLEDTGAAALPGGSFGRGRGDLTMRLSLVDFDGAAALAAAEAVPLSEPLPDGLIERHCESVIEGVARIAEWAAGTPTRASVPLASTARLQSPSADAS